MGKRIVDRIVKEPRRSGALKPLVLNLYQFDDLSLGVLVSVDVSLGTRKLVCPANICTSRSESPTIADDRTSYNKCSFLTVNGHRRGLGTSEVETSESSLDPQFVDDGVYAH
jgi:hypothetical protein